MPALLSTRLLLLVSDSVPIRKLWPLSKTSRFHTSVRLLCRVDRGHEPLTLETLGFNNDFQKTNKKETDKHQTKKSPRSKVNTLRSNREKAVSAKKSLEIEAAPFSAKSETNKKETDKHQTKESPRSKVNTLRSNREKAVSTKKYLEIEAAPFSAQSFSELGLPTPLIESLESQGFSVPTDVQSASIPTILKNHDVVIQSYTGSGKTLAYILPILSKVGPFKEKQTPLSSEEKGRKMEIEAVIVAPSRELGMQIVREFEKLLGPNDKRMVQQLVGGANRSRQEEALKKNKPAIVVGTPGRIAEISTAGKLHTHDCRYLVLDEVDALLSFNFREDMHRILEHVGRRSSARQTIMVSATIPFSVMRAARSWGRDPLLVQAKKVIPLESASPSEPITLSISNSNLQTQAAIESLPPLLKHYYSISKLQHKIDTLRRCVHALDATSVIAFMNHTKRLKDAVFKLEARGIKAAELHGELGKLARSTTLKRFKNGEVRVLVTNELSARGLDIAECDLVVNLDLPTDAVHYAHRAGRTGRLGRKGNVVTICEEPEEFVVKKLQRQLGVQIQACEFAEGKLVVLKEEGSKMEVVSD